MGAHKPNAGFLPPFAICVIECYIVSADIALLYICLITIHVSYHTWYCREVCDFNPVCSRGYTASFIGWFESAVTDWDGVFFCSVFIVCAAQIVCHMFYFILFNFNLLMLWQWNNISYMYVWHRWQIKNNNKNVLYDRTFDESVHYRLDLEKWKSYHTVHLPTLCQLTYILSGLIRKPDCWYHFSSMAHSDNLVTVIGRTRWL